jgi:hypothetical protein
MAIHANVRTTAITMATLAAIADERSHTLRGGAAPSSLPLRQLQIGAVTQTVDVHADAEMIETKDNSIA